MLRTRKFPIAALILCGSLTALQSAPAQEIDMASPGHENLLFDSGLGQAVTDESLDALTGRQEMSINNLEMQVINSDQQAQADNNSIVNSSIMNGGNSISGSAFSQASGLVTVIQNSGNQVLIQNDLIMNLTVK